MVRNIDFERRAALRGAALLAVAGALPARLRAQAWPSKAIRFVVPFAPAAVPRSSRAPPRRN